VVATGSRTEMSPRTRNCRRKLSQWNTASANGCTARARPFSERLFVKKRSPWASQPLSRTTVLRPAVGAHVHRSWRWGWEGRLGLGVVHPPAESGHGVGPRSAAVRATSKFRQGRNLYPAFGEIEPDAPYCRPGQRAFHKIAVFGQKSQSLVSPMVFNFSPGPAPGNPCRGVEQATQAAP